jgi:hypothetical protein
MYLDAHSSPTRGAKPWWIEFASTNEIGMNIKRGAAPTAIRVGHVQMALDSAPIGI